MATQTIVYRFSHRNGRRHELEVRCDAETLVAERPAPASRLPIWTRLDFCKCPNCPLSSAQQHLCPAAEALVPFVEACGDLQSHEPVHLEVETPERTFVKATTAQRAYSSLLGLLLATSGCPLTAVLRPMARFHLPLADEAETVFRATSTYLLLQYFRVQNGEPADFAFTGLVKTYEDLQAVNGALARRLRLASDADAAPNAIVLLDLLARLVPLNVRDRLEQLRPIFASSLTAIAGAGSR